MHDIFNEVFGDVFGDMFGGRRPATLAARPRGQDLRYDLEITLEQAYAGAEVEITVPAALTCETCEGSGAKPGTSPTDLQHLRRRRAACAPRQGFFSIERTCPRCGGSGPAGARPLRATATARARCGASARLQVRIPAGVDDGARIRLAGEGDAGARGGPRGDLYIFLSVKPHELFERDGLDLLCTVPVPMAPRPSAARSRRPCLLGGENCDGELQDHGQGARGRPDRQAPCA